jgi:hypothetical protein
LVLAAIGLVALGWLGGSQVDHRIIELDHKVAALRHFDLELEKQLQLHLRLP